MTPKFILVSQRASVSSVSPWCSTKWTTSVGSTTAICGSSASSRGLAYISISPQQKFAASAVFLPSGLSFPDTDLKDWSEYWIWGRKKIKRYFLAMNAPLLSGCLPTVYTLQTSAPLKTALVEMGGDPPENIPRIVRLLENPASSLALPGCTDLYVHDCLHIVLGRAFLLDDEAFVIGFSMGTARTCKAWHVAVLKFASRVLYPRQYQFQQEHLATFDEGFAYARSLSHRDLHRFNFRSVENWSVASIRTLLGIDVRYCKTTSHSNSPQSPISSH